MWADLEKAWVAHLAAELGVRAGTDVPGTLEQLPSFVRVSRGPGADDGLTDSPLLDIEVFASTAAALPIRPAASAIAERVRSVVHDSVGRRIGKDRALLVDRVTTTSGPSYVDYKNPAVARYVLSFRVEYRRN